LARDGGAEPPPHIRRHSRTPEITTKIALGRQLQGPKPGAGIRAVTLNDAIDVTNEKGVDLVALDEALFALAKLD